MLNSQHLSEFDKNGFLVLPDFIQTEDLSDLIKAAEELVKTFDVSQHPLTTFETSHVRQNHSDYFLQSGDTIRFFLEESAVKDGKLDLEPRLSVNKIGHALHELNPVYRRFSSNESIKAIARSFQYKDPRILQSMLIFKQPKIGGPVTLHQDSTFLFTEPLSAIGFWFALEDCTPTNGCLWFLPGSHKTHPVTRRFVRSKQLGTEFINIDTPEIPVSHVDEQEYVCVPVKAGSLVLIHGSVIHKSEANLSDKSRWAYAFHIIEGEDAGCQYPTNNWLQPSANIPFTKLYSFH